MTVCNGKSEFRNSQADQEKQNNSIVSSEFKEFTYYGTGEPVRMGDIVRVRLHFWHSVQGVVTDVYDPNLASPPNGPNEYGYGISLDDGSAIFATIPEKRIELLSRGEGGE